MAFFIGYTTRCGVKKNKSRIWGAMDSIYKGENHHNWKGGRTKREGYINVHLDGDSPYVSMRIQGWKILEHRLIMAQSLGRCLSEDEIVHHINGVKDDNRLENLALIKRNGHNTRTLLEIAQAKIRELEK